jgi:hypothetical protein
MTEPGAEEIEGGAIVNAAWVGTAVFTVSAVGATVWPDVFSGAAAFVAVALFTVGCAVFLWAYAVAVGRSRTDEIGIGGLYFLAGTAPRTLALRLRLALVIEVAVALATAAIRPYTSLAFGILTPVFGLGMCGLWGARYGTFRRRCEPAQQDERRT